jgi:hypothetical protein
VKVTDADVERAAKAVERYTTACYEWTDEQFEIWWNKDPVFVERVHCWGHFTGTNKQYLLHKTRIALEAANAVWSLYQ